MQVRTFGRAIVLLFAAFILLFSTCLFGQSTATVQGLVTDPSGGVVPGATITVTSVASGVSQKVKTDNAGNYQVPALLIGTYNVSAEATGFSKQVANGLVLEVNRTTTQNFQMKLAQASEVVNVEGTVPVIDQTTITVGQTINQRTVQEIPLNGRHFVDLSLLVPGTVTPPQNGFLTAPLRGQGSFGVNTAGNREDTVNFMINGVNLNDMVQNQITFQPSINTVSEFKLDNSTYSAEYGRNSGAIVNIATRSGTNAFHGEGFDFIRNNALDARNYFNQKPVRQSQFVRNNFGGALGGPVIHDKVFFFGSYEGLRQLQGLTINSGVPSAAQIAQITDATSQKLAALLPAANDPTGTRFIGSASANVQIDQGTGDVYYNVSERTRVHGYYVFQRDHRVEPTLQGNTVPAFGDTRQSHRQVATFELTQTFTNALVNEFRLGGNRIHIVFGPNNTTNPASVGIADGINVAQGLPQISIGGVGVNFGGPSGFPQGRGDTTGIVSDVVNYLHGNHSLKFGGEFRRFYNNNFASDIGTLSFNSFSEFAAGHVDGFTITTGNQPSRVATGGLGAFFMDSWKIHRNLTLELGLRYEWNQTPTEALNRFVNFVPATDSLVRTSSPYQQNNKNFEPRVGFAWDAFGTGHTVVRAGYGYMVEQPIANLVGGLTTNPPLAQPLAFVASKTTPFTSYGNLVSAAGASGLSPIVVDPNFKNSYTQQFNFNVQQQLARNWGMMVGYFGNKGTDLRTRVNENQFLSPGVRPFPKLSATSPIDPGVTLGNISENISKGNSNYNALWITSNLQPMAGLQFNASYTWSKAMDYTSQNGQAISSQGFGVQNSFFIRGDYGPSDYDARNRFSMNLIYDLPFKRENRFLGGFEIAGIIQSQSGNPIANIFVGSSTTAGLTGITNLRPDLIGPVQIVNQKLANGAVQYFVPSVCDPAAKACAPGTTFAFPDAGGLHFGDLRRNSIYGPGFNDLDLSLIKRTKITERLSMELRADAFDVLNHPNFGQPGRNALVGSTSFGVISSTRFPAGDSGSSRQMQFAAKIIF